MDDDDDEEAGTSSCCGGEEDEDDKMATIGLSKVFILDKYFTELQKFWETERKVQGSAVCYFQSIQHCDDFLFCLTTANHDTRLLYFCTYTS